MKSVRSVFLCPVGATVRMLRHDGGYSSVMLVVDVDGVGRRCCAARLDDGATEEYWLPVTVLQEVKVGKARR